MRRAVRRPARANLQALTGLQLAILDVIWERREATAHEIHEALAPRLGLARGTIGTLLHRLERQRILAHRQEGREFYYRATCARDEVLSARVQGLVAGLFGGSLAAMVNFAVSSADVSKDDLLKIRTLLDQQRATHKP